MLEDRWTVMEASLPLGTKCEERLEYERCVRQNSKERNDFRIFMTYPFFLHSALAEELRKRREAEEAERLRREERKQKLREARERRQALKQAEERMNILPSGNEITDG